MNHVLVSWSQWQAMSEDERDAFILRRAQETAAEYLPFEALVRQHEKLFGEKLGLPVDSETPEER